MPEEETPPNVETLYREISELDRQLSGAINDTERLLLLSDAFLKDKRESIHLQISTYEHHLRTEALLELLTSRIDPVYKAFTGGKIIRAFAVGFAKTLLLVSAVIGGSGIIIAGLRQLLK